jgi:hypothetical protein
LLNGLRQRHEPLTLQLKLHKANPMEAVSAKPDRLLSCPSAVCAIRSMFSARLYFFERAGAIGEDNASTVANVSPVADQRVVAHYVVVGLSD